MRGEHLLVLALVNRNHGIIPACAGSTERHDRWYLAPPGSSPHARGARKCGYEAWTYDEDHPRMRGEHKPFEHVSVCASGIIPACAGSTGRCRMTGWVVLGSSPHARGAPTMYSAISPRPRDHPRMRGEHSAVPLSLLRTAGIIPACAGST